MKKDTLEKLKGGLIISCQAYEDNPLYGVENMVTLAKCAEAGGADGLRLCWPEAVREVRKVTDLPIVGINKIIDPEHFDMYRQVFITPTYESAVEMIEAGCDIVALDGTLRGRKPEELEKLIGELKKNYPDVLLMADIATMKEAQFCEKIGFDILSSTLSGYTEETMDRVEEEPDYAMIEGLVNETGCLVNAEGRIWNRDQLKRVMALKPDMITVGTAVTNPMKITQYLKKVFEETQDAGKI